MSHEKPRREEAAPQTPDRAFGWVMVLVFLIVAVLPLWSGSQARVWALWVAASLACTTVALPALLGPLNGLWAAFGEGMRRLVSPFILTFIFFAVLTPIGLLMRLFGKDPMRRRFDAQLESYWIPRDPPGPGPASFTDQF